MKAVDTDLTFVKNCCPPGYYRSVWDRLVDQLFGATPVGMGSEEQIPYVDIWKDGVVKTNDTEPYSFTIVTDDSDTPKAGDIVLYKGVYYVIGTVA